MMWIILIAYIFAGIESILEDFFNPLTYRPGIAYQNPILYIVLKFFFWPIFLLDYFTNRSNSFIVGLILTLIRSPLLMVLCFFWVPIKLLIVLYISMNPNKNN